jgi:hypothetical protein
MRVMLKITMPTEPGNRGIKDGSLPKLLEDTLSRLKPEAAYFFPYNGERTALIFFDLADVADIPVIIEPLFLGVEADVEVVPVMTIDDLRKGLATI